MKLSLTLLATASYCAPERKKHQNLTNERSSGAPVPCSAPVSDSTWLDQNVYYGGSPFKSTDNGQFGQVATESYTNFAYCYVEIGSSCDADGVQVEIAHMELETWNNECHDTIHFEWLNKDGETVEQTDPQCGCTAENHPSCDGSTIWPVLVTEKPLQYNLVGTDAKLVLSSDKMTSNRPIVVNWKCSNAVTNTLEMADALLTSYFTPEMARDYGCTGRGLFDPFAHTIGNHVDHVDYAFYKWKKCVQCASGNDKSNVLAYSYDVESDTCVDGPWRSFCECDRSLMKYLKLAPAMQNSDFPADQCVPRNSNGGGPGECCQYDTHFWVHYNPNSSCCGPDGVQSIGSC